MGKINDVRAIIEANKGKDRSEIVTIVALQFDVARALAHSYVYHAQKSSGVKKTEKAEKPKKVAAAKKPAAKKVKKKAVTKDVAAKNLETIKAVGKKRKAVEKKAEQIDEVVNDLNPQLLREEVDQIIAEIDRNGKSAIPKFMHDDFAE